MVGRKKRYTEPAGKKEWSDGGQELTDCRENYSRFWQIKPENSVGNFYSSGFTTVPPGIFENIHAKQPAVPVQTINILNQYFLNR